MTWYWFKQEVMKDSLKKLVKKTAGDTRGENRNMEIAKKTIV
jgi:hypothetical protein